VTSKRPQLLLVIMGVSGCGKSTFASAISAALGLSMVDGDDLHAPESVAKMQAGIALNDADRWPWLDRIAHTLAANSSSGENSQGKVVACSALKRAYRDRIRAALPQVTFVFLDGDSELIRRRMASRTGHFMQPELLDSQLRTLERPAPDETDVITVSVDQSVDAMVLSLTGALQSARQAAASLSTN
jgi:gluconokinase